MKKIGAFIFYLFLGIIGFAILCFAAEAILSRIPGDIKKTSISAHEYNVYVMSNGVHTDIVLPVKSNIVDWMTVFPTRNNLSQDSIYNYIAIGWGDRGFYLNTPEWKDLTMKTALIAALGLGKTALHVTYYKQVHEDSFCYKVAIDSLQFIALKDYILASYAQGENSKPILIHTTAQYGKTDAFYEAKGSYSMFHSCNTWANDGLKAADMPAAMWTVFDTGILRHYKK